MAGPSLATDFSQFATLRAQARDQAQGPEAIRRAAQQFEALFVQQLLKAAHAAPMGDDLMGDAQGGMVRDLFDQQIAMHMASGKGLGLADLLVRQLKLSTGLAATPAATNGTVMPAQAGIQFSSSVAPQPKLDSRLRGNDGVDTPSVADTAPSAQPGPVEFATQADFVNAVKPHAEAAAKELGIDPHVLIAQAALETGWGRRLMRNSDGSPAFNFFGIKADKRWEGPRTTQATHEFENGQMQRQNAEFRSYGSIAESFADYASFLKSNPRYADALRHDGDAARFAHGLQKAGYATDPGYARKVLRLATRIA